MKDKDLNSNEQSQTSRPVGEEALTPTVPEAEGVAPLADPAVPLAKGAEVSEGFVLSVPSLAERIKAKSGDEVEFDEGTASLSLKQGMRFSNAGKRSKNDYYATDEELSIINGEGNTNLKSEDIFVFALDSADMAIDRQDEKFTDKALNSMALMSNDKAFLLDHSWDTTHQIGKIFAGTVEDGKLKQKVYVLNHPQNDYVVRNILAGIYNKVSVGFSSNVRDMTCSSCGDGTSIYDAACPHMPGAIDDKGMKTHIDIQDVSDYYEVSLVPIPAQRAAGIRRNSSTSKSVAQGTAALERPSVLIDSEKILADISEILAPTEQIIAADNVEVKNLDTIESGNNHLGDETVPKNTTADSGNVVDATEAIVASEVAAVAAQVTSEVAAVATEDAVVAAEATAAEVAPEAQGAEAPPETAAEAVAETVAETPADSNEASVEDLDVTKQLQKAVGDLSSLIQILHQLVEQQKALAATSQQVELSMKAQDEKLKALTDIVEAATAVTVESIERSFASKTHTEKPGNGNQWAVDLTKKLMGGN